MPSELLKNAGQASHLACVFFSAADTCQKIRALSELIEN